MARLPGSPKPPGSGRRRGTLDKEARQMLSGKMAKAIYDTYLKLGNDWLLKIAQDRPELFCSVFLQRLLPPALKDPADDAPLVALNFKGDPTEAARRVAFLLAKGANELGQDAEVIAQRTPYVHLDPDPSPQELLRVDQPDPEHEAWAAQASLTQEERLAAEDLDQHCNRRAFAAPRPAWMDQPKPAGRPRVGHPRRDDLL